MEQASNENIDLSYEERRRRFDEMLEQGASVKDALRYGYVATEECIRDLMGWIYKEKAAGNAYKSPIISIVDNTVFRWSLADYRSKRRRREEYQVHIRNYSFSSHMEAV